jgi:hypothetical protein
MAVRRGQFIGERVDGEPDDEAEHLMRCPRCGGLVDMRDLGQVFEHEGPLPHPKQDQPQQLEAHGLKRNVRRPAAFTLRTRPRIPPCPHRVRCC